MSQGGKISEAPGCCPSCPSQPYLPDPARAAILGDAVKTTGHGPKPSPPAMTHRNINRSSAWKNDRPRRGCFVRRDGKKKKKKKGDPSEFPEVVMVFGTDVPATRGWITTAFPCRPVWFPCIHPGPKAEV